MHENLRTSHQAFKSYRNFQDFQNYYIKIFETSKNFKLRVKLEAIRTLFSLRYLSALSKNFRSEIYRN